MTTPAVDGGTTLSDAVVERGSTPQLEALTDQVLVAGSGSVMHAPATDGPLCGNRGRNGQTYRCVDCEVFAGHRRPCRDCFDLEALDLE